MAHGFTHGMRVEKAAEWRERFERFHRAGTSIARFCRRERISASSFYLWRRKLRDLPPLGAGRFSREETATQPRQGNFIPIRVHGDSNACDQRRMTAKLPGGTRLIIPVADAESLQVALVALARIDAERADAERVRD